jgi:hypothetical protein
LLFSTKQGKQQAQDFLARRQAMVSPLFETLSKTEQIQLLNALEKMLFGLPQDQQQARAICHLCDGSVCHLEGCPVHQALP